MNSFAPAGGVKVNTSGEIGSSTVMLSNLTVSLVLIGPLAPGMVILLVESSW